MRIGYCTNCGNDYKVFGYKEILVKFKPEETRLYSVCSLCYEKLNDDTMLKIIANDSDYVTRNINNDITKTAEQKKELIDKLNKRKYINWGYNIDELNKKTIYE